MCRHKTKIGLIGIAASVFFCFPIGSARAALFDFTEIVEIDDVFDVLGNYDLNNHGQVAFRAHKVGSGDGIFVGTGGPIDTIATDFFSSFSTPSINNAGLIAFRLGGTIFTSDGTTLSPVATTSGPFSTFGLSPSINNAGTVAFSATLDAGGEGLFLSSGGLITTIADSTGPFAFFASPSLNDTGSLAVRAVQDSGIVGIFTLDGSTTTTIAEIDGGFSFLDHDLSINKDGTVAFFGTTGSGVLAVSGIFTGDGGPPTTIAEASPFGFGGATFGCCLGSPSINDDGTVIFKAGFFGPLGTGIFTGPDPVADRLIGTSDPLFGSTVNGIFDPILNDIGQFAFAVDLADGRRMIVRADPSVHGPVIPEPSSLFLLGSGLLGLAGWRRKFRAGVRVPSSGDIIRNSSLSVQVCVGERDVRAAAPAV